MTRFLTLIASLLLPAATLAAKGPGDGFVPISLTGKDGFRHAHIAGPGIMPAVKSDFFWI
jgi:hypothetical protein